MTMWNVVVASVGVFIGVLDWSVGTCGIMIVLLFILDTLHDIRDAGSGAE